MKSENFTIKEGAIFISDSHANENRLEFLNFLKSIKNGEISTPQLFLMGDMFDFLAGYCDYTAEFFSEYIVLLNEIAKNLEVYYLEGNHDFNLDQIFKNIKIFPIANQPVKFQTQDGQSVALAHGDIFLPFVSKYALRFLRLKWFLKFMNLLDHLLKFKISKAILEKLRYKNLSYKIPNFINLAEKRVENYSEDIVLEGHFHQGEIFEIQNQVYVNVVSFACEQRYLVVKYDKKIKFAQKSIRGQDV